MPCSCNPTWWSSEKIGSTYFSLLVSDTEFGGLLPTHFTYDTHGRLSAATTGAHNISYGYDPRGNLTSVVDPLDRTTNYSYDPLDRPTRIDWPDSSTVRSQFDASANLTVFATPVPADNHFDYNGVNRVSGFTTPLGSVTSYAYDKERKLTAIKLPSGKTINNTYTHDRLSETTTAEWTLNEKKRVGLRQVGAKSHQESNSSSNSLQ